MGPLRGPTSSLFSSSFLLLLFSLFFLSFLFLQKASVYWTGAGFCPRYGAPIRSRWSMHLRGLGSVARWARRATFESARIKTPETCLNF